MQLFPSSTQTVFSTSGNELTFGRRRWSFWRVPAYPFSDSERRIAFEDHLALCECDIWMLNLPQAGEILVVGNRSADPDEEHNASVWFSIRRGFQQSWRQVEDYLGISQRRAVGDIPAPQTGIPETLGASALTESDIRGVYAEVTGGRTSPHQSHQYSDTIEYSRTVAYVRGATLRFRTYAALGLVRMFPTEHFRLVQLLVEEGAAVSVRVRPWRGDVLNARVTCWFEGDTATETIDKYHHAETRLRKAQLHIAPALGEQQRVADLFLPGLANDSTALDRDLYVEKLAASGWVFRDDILSLAPRSQPTFAPDLGTVTSVATAATGTNNVPERHFAASDLAPRLTPDPPPTPTPLAAADPVAVPTSSNTKERPSVYDDPFS